MNRAIQVSYSVLFLLSTFQVQLSKWKSKNTQVLQCEILNRYGCMKKVFFCNIQSLTNNKENVDNKQMMISTVIAPST